ncbi:MAG: hypothetical protein AABW88_04880 [Nanoarchaeota archaeon]
MKPYQAYLQCEVNPGMFHFERSVNVYDEYGNPIASGFFPEQHINNGKLEVIVLEKNKSEVFIEPIGAHSGQGFLENIRRVWVPKSSVSVLAR